MDPLEKLSRQVHVQTWVLAVIGTLLVGLLGFLAMIKDRDLDQRVRSLEEFKRLQLQWNEDQIEALRSK